MAHPTHHRRFSFLFGVGCSFSLLAIALTSVVVAILTWSSLDLGVIARFAGFGADEAAAQRAEGLRLYAEGFLMEKEARYGPAAERYQQILARYDVGAHDREVRFRLSQALISDDRSYEAASVLAEFLDSYPDDDRRLLVTLQLGRLQRTLGNYSESVRLLREYLAWPSPLDGYVALDLGSTLLDAGDATSALVQLQQAASAGLGRLATVDALEKLAVAYSRTGDSGSALLTWQRLGVLARSDVYKAETLYRQGTFAAKLGRKDVAIDLFMQVARTYPSYHWAAVSVDELDKIGGDPGFYLRGLIAYFADSEADAVSALTRFLASEPASPNAPNARIYRGLSYRYLGQPDKALADFDAVAAGSAMADEALYDAGQILESLGRRSDAIGRYRKLVDGFPRSDRWSEAAYRLAILLREENDVPGAVTVFGRLLTGTTRPEYVARANLWLGKLALARGERDAANAAWSAAEQAAPGDYYGIRARDLRLGDSLSTAPWSATADHRTESGPQETMTLVSWIAGWSGISETATITMPMPTLLADPRLARIDALVATGMLTEANEEGKDFAERLRGDPAALFQLCRWLDERELARATSYAAELLMIVSPAKSLLEAPRGLQRFAMPMPYRALVLAASQANNVDPLFFYALMRQESVYDRYAKSGADARGLTQVIPGTGKDIARALNRSNFNPNDLFRPITSLEFGAYYLGQQLKQFGGGAFLALAAYNAGPGNVTKWEAGSQTVDPDLFVERIQYRETRSYVQLVSKYYELYRRVYRD